MGSKDLSTSFWFDRSVLFLQNYGDIEELIYKNVVSVFANLNRTISSDEK